MLFKRTFYQIINPFRKLYWFSARPQTRGAKMLIEHHGLLLAIRNTYGKKHWTFPGGGVNKNETFEHAAIREAYEEVGIKIDKCRFVGTYVNTKEYKTDTVQCFLTHVSSAKFTIDPGEILEAQWVDPTDFPQPCSPRVPVILRMLNSI